MTVKNPEVSGRGWAYTGAILGGGVSIAANVAHSYIAPPGAPLNWHPDPGAVTSAIVWPTFLFVAVEILARVPWPRRLGWDLARFGGLLPVALVAAFVSYRHLSGLLAYYGEDVLVSTIGPLAVDGLMIMATAALIATGARARAHRTTSPTPSPTPTPPIPAIQPTPAPAPVMASTSDTVVPVAPRPVAPAVVATPADMPPRQPEHRPVPRPNPSQPVTADPRRPASPATRPVRPAASLPASTTDTTTVTGSEPSQPHLPGMDLAAVAQATRVAREHQRQHGSPMTAGQLAVAARISTTEAGKVLTALATDTPDRPVNGHPVTTTTQ